MHSFCCVLFCFYSNLVCEKQRPNHTKQLVFYSRIYCHPIKSCLIKLVQIQSEVIKFLFCVSFLCHFLAKAYAAPKNCVHTKSNTLLGREGLIIYIKRTNCVTSSRVLHCVAVVLISGQRVCERSRL